MFTCSTNDVTICQKNVIQFKMEAANRLQEAENLSDDIDNKLNTIEVQTDPKFKEKLNDIKQKVATLNTKIKSLSQENKDELRTKIVGFEHRIQDIENGIPDRVRSQLSEIKTGISEHLINCDVIKDDNFREAIRLGLENLTVADELLIRVEQDGEKLIRIDKNLDLIKIECVGAEKRVTSMCSQLKLKVAIPYLVALLVFIIMVVVIVLKALGILK